MYYYPKKATICFTVFLLLFLYYTLSAQTTFNISSKTTGDTLLTIDNNGRMGLGITVPVAGLHLANNYGAVLSGTFGEGSIPVEGAGTRLMWYPAKSAFRVGTVNGDQWDDGNIGDYSIAIGRRTTANGSSAITLGNFTTASGNYSMAFGRGAVASGENAISIGRSIEAAGNFSIAIGVGEQGGTVVSQDTSLVIYGGRVGIHTLAPTSGFEVADTIYSSFGGFMFPDGTVQETAASSGGGNTLDQAYDQGGAGVGRSITADNGAVTIAGTDGFLSTGTFSSGSIPAEGGGTRLMWYPSKAAFRVGQVLGSNWDDSQTGNHSIAIGYNNLASGNYSTALGGNNTASGNISTTLGGGNVASGVASTAMGNNTEASGGYATAMGSNTIASGSYSTAIGRGIEASGNHTIAVALSDQASLNVSQDTTMAIMGGYVGIGTISPTTRLQVADTIYSSLGGFKFPDGTTQGTAGITSLSAGPGIVITNGNHISLSHTI